MIGLGNEWVLLTSLRVVSGLMISLMTTSLHAQSRSVWLEIVVGNQEAIGVEQDILKHLEHAGADNLKIRRGGTDNVVKAAELEGASVNTIQVTGVYSNRKIVLPGGTFNWTDATGIAELLQQFRDDGAATALAEKLAFGLTSEQLVLLNEDLSRNVDGTSKETSLLDFVRTMQTSLTTPLSFDKEVETILRESGSLYDSVDDQSAGTALAIALRPYGLVLVPSRQQGKPVELTIQRSERASEFWPVGWPPEAMVRDVAPILLDRIDVEIRDFKLGDTLQALQKRVKLPMFIDHNSLAEKEIELNEVLVTYEKKQADYQRIFNSIASQARPSLRVELRVDEAQKPFLWIY